MRLSSLLLQARCILTDSQLMFYCGFAFYVSLCWWRRLNEESDPVAPRPMTPLERWGW
jgi:hypothetical protein